MHPLKQQARVAGFLYLLVVLIGPFILLYVPGKLFVTGDASATAANILANEPLFRGYIVAEVIGELAFIGVALALYRLFKDVDAQLSGLMVIFVLILAPISFLEIANEVATLAMLKGGGSLAAFDKPQRDALATLMIGMSSAGISVYVLFWGLWLLPLAMLVYRSRFMPRWLGVWLFINGVTYIVISAIGLLTPEYKEIASKVATPILLGEVALMLYLVIVGAREQPVVAVA